MTEQAVDKGIPKETCIHDLKKMLIYSIIKNGGKNVYYRRNYEKLRVIGLFYYTRVFFGVLNMRVSHKLQALQTRGNAATDHGISSARQ